MITFDPTTGMFLGESDNSSLATPIQNVTLLNALPAGTCVAIVNYSAVIVTSLYNNSYTGLTAPYVTGIILTDGGAGDIVPMACLNNYLYSNTLLNLGYAGDILYLSQSGRLTTTVPSHTNGDHWFVIVARRLNNNTFIFTPFTPIDISSGIVVPSTPNYYPTPTTDTIVLAQAMPQLSTFRIGSDGLAYLVTANDATVPIIDGITLESGGINQQITIGRLRNQWYTVSQFFSSQSFFWLTSSGGITNTKPANVVWCMIVGRSTPNSNEFIYDPQLPIRLA